jgi:hypothetical protein
MTKVEAEKYLVNLLKNVSKMIFMKLRKISMRMMLSLFKNISKRIIPEFTLVLLAKGDVI